MSSLIAKQHRTSSAVLTTYHSSRCGVEGEIGFRDSTGIEIKTEAKVEFNKVLNNCSFMSKIMIVIKVVGMAQKSTPPHLGTHLMSCLISRGLWESEVRKEARKVVHNPSCNRSPPAVLSSQRWSSVGGGSLCPTSETNGSMCSCEPDSFWSEAGVLSY
ncbi:hypothetical protein EVAR_20742_1 [Eumeta japonica]|uniref:Uncharacterized protein n=1 Tax=Eumeta variegata TaxID=151549 RepID=A0A4C1V9M1_EUMVA|nr:hypothetical protein EVAR_20742_1 [Eumeta japonica]